jgi:hypothetical protein
MSDKSPDATPKENPVTEYKEILRAVLDRRPSGTRQRLATVLGKNRSFISQISNPAYAVPIPIQHVDRIFEVCHFSPADRRAFLDAYARAHPRRVRAAEEDDSGRMISVQVPDLGDPARNTQLERLINEFARRVAQLVKPTP